MLINRVGPGYFKALGMALLAGRDFDRRDTVGSPTVAIVNEAFARRFGTGANPVSTQASSPSGTLCVTILAEKPIGLTARIVRAQRS